MQFITGQPSHQTYFATLEDRVPGDNPVRLIDAFIDKLGLQKLGFNKTVHHSEGRPPYAPVVLLKLYLYGNNIKQNPHYYKRRQAIVEHPFGTIKRYFGFTHTLLKGLQKINGEMNLIMFCYNFLRTKNILGFDKMLKSIQNWQPDYSKAVCVLKNGFIKMIYSQNKPSIFWNMDPFLFLKAS